MNAKRIGLLFLIIAVPIVSSFFYFIRPVAASTTIVVTTSNDSIANDSSCSLREAIIAANTDSSFNGCAAGSGADIISFSPSLPTPTTFLLTITGKNEDSGLSGDLDITDDVTIVGAGETATLIDGNNSDRVFEVQSGIHITMSAMTIQNGNPGVGINGAGLLNWGEVILSNATVQGNQGSGISSDSGLITLTNVQIKNNSGYGIRNVGVSTLFFEGGLVSNNGEGGVYNNASTATLNNLTIQNNSNGSGVYSVGNTSLTRIYINSSDISTNTASANGGGIYNSGNFANATISRSRISGNQANAGSGAGGGIFNNGILTINESTIDNNAARTGGGIEHSGANLYMTNDTISGNQAADNGGGLYNRGSAVLKSVTLYANGGSTGANIFNDESSMAIGNSIVANGSCFNSNGFINSLGYNLDSGNSCVFSATGDLSNTNPQLGVLQDNGGPTMTHGLAPGSPAIDAGNNNDCPAVDQRGVVRPLGIGCDIGAYEAGETADLAITSLDTYPALIGVSSMMRYTIHVTNGGPLAATSVVLTDTLPSEVTYVSATAVNGGSCVTNTDNSTVTCSLASLSAGAGWDVIIVVETPAVPGTIVNQAAVQSDSLDGNLENNTAVSSTDILILNHLFLPLITVP